MDSALRPRDIQARIRSGESAEEVAAAAGTSVEVIMPYASPVLAERAHVAWNAQKSSLRRASGPSGGGRTLGEAVELFLGEHRLHDDDVAWDSWRRADGRWVLTADIDAQGVRRSAEFVHDVAGRYVVAENDDARTITGELGAGPAGPAPRRLTSLVGGHDQDLPLGDDAIELVRDREDEPTDVEQPDVEQPEVEQPEHRPFEVPVGDADWMRVDGAAPVEEPTDVPPPGATRSAEEPDPVADADARPDPDSEDTAEIVVAAADPEVVAEVRERPAGRSPEPDSGPERPAEPEEPELDLGVEPQETAAQKTAKRKGRASVPSWDEIMFGGGPDS
ncbi:septation protein SepH [Nocardioides aurantiacus]|uniref:DUF3071 domain-containing protein n=1 Tax=Nocardioides aurantiacus TaxID=86796 RepID=A0A3N2CVA6_9ACTN|nr:septation protein SepH [Nocardioides aurantiacus]ROR91358.1 hypothetical protein EDD33_2224 [Nocardioides aurantiacus]